MDVILLNGPSIKYVDKYGGKLVKCYRYYISLCIKLANTWGRGDQKLATFCLRSLWMPPNSNDQVFMTSKVPLYWLTAAQIAALLGGPHTMPHVQIGMEVQ